MLYNFIIIIIVNVILYVMCCICTNIFCWIQTEANTKTLCHFCIGWPIIHHVKFTAFGGKRADQKKKLTNKYFCISYYTIYDYGLYISYSYAYALLTYNLCLTFLSTCPYQILYYFHSIHCFAKDIFHFNSESNSNHHH